MAAFFFQLTQKRSYFVELRKEWCGFGVERYEQDAEVFAGWLQITVSEGRGQVGAGRPTVRRRTAVAAALVALMMPTQSVIAAAAEWCAVKPYCPFISASVEYVPTGR